MFQISSAARVEEAKILWAQEQQGMAVNLVKYILQHSELEPADSAAIHCLTGKWLAETRSESFRVILDGYLKKAVGLVVEASNKKNGKPTTCNSERWMQQQCRTYYRLAHYADALYRSYEHRLTSNEWQAALRLRQHKARELEVMMKRLDVQKVSWDDSYYSLPQVQSSISHCA
jgi:ataxia telangiectasia mutated family protein